MLATRPIGPLPRSRSMTLPLIDAAARVVHAVTGAFETSTLARRLVLGRVYRRELAAVRAELASYTDRELASDLRVCRSDVPWIAATEAERRLSLFVIAHPEYRAAWHRHGHHEGVAMG